MSSTLSADNLHGLPGIRHDFFTRQWGDCGFSQPGGWSGNAATNRAAVAAHMGVMPENLLSAYQIHSPNVVTVTEAWKPEDRPQADALVTTTKNIALGVLTADCVPVLFADVRAGVIGAAHAGWRGALGGVIANTLDAMEKLGASKKAVHAAIGPCIWQNSYEVGPDFLASFLAEIELNERFFRPSAKQGHYLFDLPAYVTSKLRAQGVVSIASSPADTYADEARFFSYRRSTLRGVEREGNLISAIVLKE